MVIPHVPLSDNMINIITHLRLCGAYLLKMRTEGVEILADWLLGKLRGG